MAGRPTLPRPLRREKRRRAGGTVTRALGLAVGVAALLAAAVLGRVRVSGDSMRPALEAGDRLIVVRPLRHRLRAGQVVVALDPRAQPGRRVLVKRVASVRGGVVELAGDNPDASTDSRHFGPVHVGSIVGVAVYRYAPAERAGWLGSR